MVSNSVSCGGGRWGGEGGGGVEREKVPWIRRRSRRRGSMRRWSKRRERRRRRRRRGYGKDKRRHRRRKEWRWQFAESALPTNTGAIPPSTSILSFHNFSISISTQSFHNLAAVSSSY